MQRGIGIALIVAVGNCGGFVATFTFLGRDAPEYKTGYAVLLGFLALAAVAEVGYAGLVVRGNKKKRSSLEEDLNCGTNASGNEKVWKAML